MQCGECSIPARRKHEGAQAFCWLWCPQCLEESLVYWRCSRSTAHWLGCRKEYKGGIASQLAWLECKRGGERSEAQAPKQADQQWKAFLLWTQRVWRHWSRKKTWPSLDFRTVVPSSTRQGNSHQRGPTGHGEQHGGSTVIVDQARAHSFIQQLFTEQLPCARHLWIKFHHSHLFLKS